MPSTERCSLFPGAGFLLAIIWLSTRDWHLLMTKKIGHSLNQEYAIGVVGLADRIREELARRYKEFMGDKEPVDIQGRTVIVVDDGSPGNL